MKSETFTLVNTERPSEATRFWKVGKRCMARPYNDKYRVNSYRDISSGDSSCRIFHKYGCELVCFDEEVTSDTQTETPEVVSHLRENREKADKMFKEFMGVCNGTVQGLETLSSTQESGEELHTE